MGPPADKSDSAAAGLSETRLPGGSRGHWQVPGWPGVSALLVPLWDEQRLCSVTEKGIKDFVVFGGEHERFCRSIPFCEANINLRKRNH